MNELNPAHLPLLLSAVLFATGAAGVAIRRNPLVMFMCIELMLNAANLAFASFSRYSTRLGQGDPLAADLSPALGSQADGSIFVFLVMTIAAAEAVVGLAIIIAIFRSRKEVDADELSALKG